MAQMQDIGEEDRLMSRLEGEMTVSSEQHADFTMSILATGPSSGRFCALTLLQTLK